MNEEQNRRKRDLEDLQEYKPGDAVPLFGVYRLVRDPGRAEPEITTRPDPQPRIGPVIRSIHPRLTITAKKLEPKAANSRLL